MKTLDIAHITWRDALGNTTFWEELDSIIDGLIGESDLMETVGQIIDIDSRYVTIASSIHYDRDGKPVKAGGIFSIPIGCIIKMRKISGPIKRKS